VNGRREHADANERHVAPGLTWLLLQAHDLAARVKDRHAEVARVGDLGQQDLRVGPCPPERVGQRRDAADDEVVPQVQNEGVVRQVLPGDEDGVRQPERDWLVQVGDVKAERRAVADGRLDLLCGRADHHARVGDPRVPQGLQAVEKDGLVGDGKKLLGRGVRDRT
jgi:hypothetical protein